MFAVTTPTIFAPPARTFNPSLAVTIPTESILVTSSYVSVPPIDTLPPTDKSFSTPIPPSNITDPVSFEVDWII